LAWAISFSETAEKQLSKLDHQVQQRIRSYLKNRIAPNNPRDFGKALRENLSGLWRYRVGDYRIIADIQDENVLVLVVRVRHRSDVYGGR
jgi:mRNA interferase RelE/StbE